MTRTVTAHTIASALDRVKARPQLVQHQHVLDACHGADHVWRDGVLNPLATISGVPHSDPSRQQERANICAIFGRCASPPRRTARRDDACR